LGKLWIRNDADKAFDWLERSYKQRDTGLAEMKGDPLLRSLEHDPRYRAFLQKMKLPVNYHLTQSFYAAD